MVRIQFDLTEEEYKEFEPYIRSKKIRHEKAKDAFFEWLKRQEARNTRAREERILKEREFILTLINEVLNERR